MAVELDSFDLDLHSFADGLPGGFFIYEAHGAERILFANDQLASLFGCETVDEFYDLVGGSFSGMVHRRDLQRVQNAIWEQIDATRDADKSFEQRDHVNYRIVAKDGTVRYIDEYGKLVRDTSYGDLFFVFVTELIVQSMPQEQEARPPAFPGIPSDVDALTGLPSMRYYHAHSRIILAQAAAEHIPMVDVYFDIDHFRSINFRLGYAAGDEILQRVAKVLSNTFADDLLARFSDDHFVLVTRREGLEGRLTEVHDKVTRLISGMPVELKAGVFELTENDITIPFAHDRAKVACTSIKGRYDVFFSFYDETLAMREGLREYIVEHVAEALEKGWIRNRYQPVVRVGEGTCASMEALSRWVDPNVGTLSPAQYIHVLEDARLIHLLDSIVINQACADLRAMIDRFGAAIPVSLNFSPTALSLIDVPTLVDEMTCRYDIPKSLIHVEITESSLTDDPMLLRSVIKRLHEHGFEVWMDDFGSGYSSLNLLKDYDFDVLKVDMEFLRGMKGNEKSRTIVTAITDLAHSLNMATLVEGVENVEQMEFLHKVGANLAQGYYFSQPVPYETIVDEFFEQYPPELRV